MFCLLQPFCQKLLKCISKIKLKYVCAAIGIIIVLDVFGAFTHMFEVSYDDDFLYPYYGDIQPYVEALRHNKKPDVDPINEYNYSFIHELKEKCADPDYKTLRIVFLVKSAAEHFDRRQGIRNSWGFGKRFFDVPTRTIFLLGTHPNDLNLQEKINTEAKEHDDIVQANFVDSYYNNTIKTMLGFKWAVHHCTNSKFYMFVDDDIYISVKNVLRFIRNPTYYPDSLKEPSRMAARKREIKQSDYDDIEDTENLSDDFKDFAAEEKNKTLSNLLKTEENLKNFAAEEKNKTLSNLLKTKETLKNVAAEEKNKTLSNLLKTEETLKNFAVEEKNKTLSNLKTEENLKNFAVEEKNKTLLNLLKIEETLKNFAAEEKNKTLSNLLKTEENLKNFAAEENNKTLLNLLKTEETLKNFAADQNKTLSNLPKANFANVRKIVKRATAKEKIMMRRRPGWTSHNKTRMPQFSSKENQENLASVSKKSLSQPLKLSGNSAASRKIQENSANQENLASVSKKSLSQPLKLSENSANKENVASALKKSLLQPIKLSKNSANQENVPSVSKKSLPQPLKLSKNSANQENFPSDSKKRLSQPQKSENSPESSKISRGRRQILDLELPEDVRLFAGYVFISSPHRHRTSKWYVSLKEYPYHLWPPYVTAGAYVLSKEALTDMYYASLYTKHFRFDDIFLGLVAKKADIEPFHCDEFHFYKKDYTKFNYKYVITSHGYDDPNELVQVWQEQKSLGNA